MKANVNYTDKEIEGDYITLQLSNGKTYQLREVNGRMSIDTAEGKLIVLPVVANVIEVDTISLHS